MSQIEIWFGILARKVIKRGSFRSKEELREKLMAFIEYFNATMAKPFKWTYQALSRMMFPVIMLRCISRLSQKF
jgi:hypothetical protein